MKDLLALGIGSTKDKAGQLNTGVPLLDSQTNKWITEYLNKFDQFKRTPKLNIVTI